MVVMMAVSCNHRVEPEPAEPQLPVNFYNTAGTWKLIDWKGNDMTDGPQVVISLKTSDKTFILEQSVGSMEPTTLTGSYNIYEEEGVGMAIRGSYDFTYDYWSHIYVITSLTATKMQWTALDDPEDVSLYERTVTAGE